ncbi:hypothetical protein KFE25_013237 [Diacronema lutheri]|uniref:Uncharacterized protein n=1 Tax=Diacronema lutheri TaxID=2081491 RepID=A0A8J6C3T6_DIALT|nr:hypothetical protein KFE25_013237 [Diacronema lutheri]
MLLSRLARSSGRARALSRTLSTIDAAAPAAPPPVLVDAGFAAVVGACYVGATLWAYNDGVFGKMFGGEAKAAEQAQAKDQLTAMEEDLAAIKKAVEEGATKKKRRP